MRDQQLFPERHILNLNGPWEFAWLGDVDPDRLTPGDFNRQSVMAVPGVWDTLPSYKQKRGVGVYRKTLYTDFGHEERLSLRIGGLGLFGKIWFDGNHIADCNLPYSACNWEFRAPAGRRHEILIAVDSRFDPERSPLFYPNYDFHAFGGLYRDVSIHRLPPCAIEHLQVTPMDPAAGRVRLDIELSGDVPRQCEVSLAFDGNEPVCCRRQPENGCLKLDATVPNPRIWTPASPALHTLEVRLGGDCIRERFGLRTVSASGQDILLNGEPIELRGFNRHESHPELGPHLPGALMLEDVQWLKRMNCNFVRCVHYPHDPAFLDLCDEAGLLVWCESLGWGNTPDQLANPQFASLQETQTRRMVRNAVNHPSVIIWAFLNEADTRAEAAVPLYRRLTNAIREEDTSRLVTYASNRGEKDRCYQFADIISLNAYPGWIGPVDWNTASVDAIAPHVDSLIERVTHAAAGTDGKPLLFAEIGACALYGCHDLARSQWTEEYQADYMVEAVQAVLSNPRTCGIALWQLYDTRSYGPYGQVRSKPKGFNCAGVLDEYRRPKVASGAIADAFADRVQALPVRKNAKQENE